MSIPHIRGNLSNKQIQLELMEEAACPPQWITNDLNQLLRSSTEQQLTAIFGPREAHSFLHPTIKDKPRKPIDSSIAKRAGHMGAQELWSCLRKKSNARLEEKGLQITVNFKDLTERYNRRNFSMKNLQFSRHRLELMHKLACINRCNAEKMFDALSLPQAPASTCNELIEQMKDFKPQKERTSIDDVRSTSPSYSRCDKLLFLTETELKPTNKTNALLMHGTRRTRKTTDSRKDIEDPAPTTWEPLTALALCEQRPTKDPTVDCNIPFLHGRHQTWKVVK